MHMTRNNYFIVSKYTFSQPVVLRQGSARRPEKSLRSLLDMQVIKTKLKKIRIKLEEAFAQGDLNNLSEWENDEEDNGLKLELGQNDRDFYQSKQLIKFDECGDIYIDSDNSDYSSESDASETMERVQNVSQRDN